MLSLGGPVRTQKTWKRQLLSKLQIPNSTLSGNKNRKLIPGFSAKEFINHYNILEV